MNESQNENYKPKPIQLLLIHLHHLPNIVQILLEIWQDK